MVFKFGVAALFALVACGGQTKSVSRASARTRAAVCVRIEGLPRCYNVKVDGFAVDPDGAPRFTRLRVNEIGRDGDEIAMTLDWQGRGAGPLALEGPSGRLIATGHILPNGRAFFREVTDEKPLSQLYARGLVFGESDPARLNEVTLKWLNTVVAPLVDAQLAPTVARP